MAREPHIRVVVKRDDPIEKVLRKFKRLVERAGITKQARAKRHYEKPSDQRRRDKRKEVRNRKRAERKDRERLQRKLDRAKRKQRIGAMAHTEAPAPASPAPEPVGQS